MKKILALAVLMLFCSQAFAGELIIEKVGARKAKKADTSYSYPNSNSSYNTSYSKSNFVRTGDSQQSVLQRMGKPDVVSNGADGSQVWVYTQVKKVPGSQMLSRSGISSSSPASFNSQLASNGFGGSLYGGDSNNSRVMFTEEPEFETTSLKIKFNRNGVVESYTSDERNL